MKFVMFLVFALVLIGFLGFIALGFAPVEIQQAPIIKDVSAKIG